MQSRSQLCLCSDCDNLSHQKYQSGLFSRPNNSRRPIHYEWCFIGDYVDDSLHCQYRQVPLRDFLSTPSYELESELNNQEYQPQTLGAQSPTREMWSLSRTWMFVTSPKPTDRRLYTCDLHYCLKSVSFIYTMSVSSY